MAILGEPVNQAPVDFLSCSAFTRQQHRNVRPGNFLHNRIQPLYRRGMAVNKSSARGSIHSAVGGGSHKSPDQPKATPIHMLISKQELGMHTYVVALA